MKILRYIIAISLVALGAAAKAQGLPVNPQVALTLEFYSEFGPNGVVVTGFIPEMTCAVQLRFTSSDENSGPHDIYLGVWGPDGSWKTAVGNINTGFRLQQGFTPIARGVVPYGNYPIRLIETIAAHVRPFETIDPPGVYWGFCMALREGETVEDFNKIRNITMVPFVWSGLPPRP